MTSLQAAPERFTITCLRCDRPMLARVLWVGWEVQCPYCQSVLSVPEAPQDGRIIRARGPYLGPRKYFNFACPRCESLLEGHTGMCGQSASCPTCAARMAVPHLRHFGAPLAAELLEGDVGEAAPLHAYAASGASAPTIISRGNLTLIVCPRCNAHCAIDADRCHSCDAPFTMDGAQTMQKARSDTYGVTAVVCGVLGVLFAPTFIPGLLAVWFGLQSLLQVGQFRRARSGLIGLTLGLISLAGGVAFVWWKLKP